MNPVNAKLEELKNTARAAGTLAAKRPESDREHYLVGAYGRNARGAFDGEGVFNWNGDELVLQLNAITDKAYDRAITAKGNEMTDSERDAENAYQNYAQWAIGPLMTREQWEAKQARIKDMCEAGTLPTNPYEW